MAQKDDLTVTIKDGKNLIRELIDAINANTEAVKNSSSCTCEGKEATQPDSNKQAEQGFTQQSSQNATPPASATTVQPPVNSGATAPAPQQNNTAQVNFTSNPMITPAAQTVIPNAPNTSIPQATPSYPANEAGPAAMGTMSGSTAPTTATTPTASGASIPTAQPGITLDMLSNAGAQLISEQPNQMPQLIATLAKYGVQTVNDLPKEYYEAFANDIRAIGARI